MSLNYTPLNALKFLNQEANLEAQQSQNLEPKINLQEPKKDSPPKKINSSKGAGFDHFFFPFSIAVLFLSLTVYGVKVVLDNKSNLALSTVPKKVELALSPTIAPTLATIEPHKDLYATINGFTINQQDLYQTAQAQYANFTTTQLVTTINKNLLEFAALRQYLKQDTVLIKKLKIADKSEIKVFGDLSTDLGLLVAAYEKKDLAGKPPLTQLVEEFKKNSQIK